MRSGRWRIASIDAENKEGKPAILEREKKRSDLLHGVTRINKHNRSTANLVDPYHSMRSN